MAKESITFLEIVEPRFTLYILILDDYSVMVYMKLIVVKEMKVQHLNYLLVKVLNVFPEIMSFIGQTQ